MAKAFPNTGVTTGLSTDRSSMTGMVEGQFFYETDTNKVLVYNGSSWIELHDIDNTNAFPAAASDLNNLFGAWTSWTPQIDQGATTNIAKTVDDARYLRIGTLVVATFNLSVTGTGTAGQNLLLSFPVTPARSSVGFKYGAGAIFDSSTSINYACINGGPVGSSFVFVGDWSGYGGWGTIPNIAIANGDRISGFIAYEVATMA